MRLRVLRVEIDLSPATRAHLLNLGDLARHILHRLTRLEHKMSEIDDHLAAADTSLAGLAATLTDVAGDVQALLAAGASGFTPAQRALADSVNARLASLSTALTDLDTAVGEHDGLPVPVPPPPPEP